MSKQPVGVIGSGSFGLAIANLLSENVDVLMYARREEIRRRIERREGRYESLTANITAVSNLEHVAKECTLIFPIVPSKAFRSMMQSLGKHLKPYHMLIHGTKGLDLSLCPKDKLLSPKYIKTMSQVIEMESVVCRVGCLSGPNLSVEIMEGQPAATLIASRYNEVIRAGQGALRSHRFQVYGTNDILGAELAGALKNVIALASGILGGKGLGKNIWALLITRGLSEMVHISKAMGSSVKSFLGVAGIGDLVATAASNKSRNYTVGYRLAKGETLEKILNDMSEVAEGIRTLDTVKTLVNHFNISAPITEVIHRVFRRGMDIDRAIHFLMTYPYAVDVDFL